MLTRLMITFLSIAVIALAAAVIAVGVIEWAAGCGQTIHHADGSTRMGECVIITWVNEE